MGLVFYNPNSTIDNVTNPFSSGCTPCHSLPLHQPIEGGHGRAEMGSEIRPGSMGLLLKAAGSGEHGKDRLKDHPLAPRVTGTHFQIGRVAGLGMKALISESDHRMKDRIVDIGCAPIPIDDPAPLVDDHKKKYPQRAIARSQTTRHQGKGKIRCVFCCFCS